MRSSSGIKLRECTAPDLDVSRPRFTRLSVIRRGSTDGILVVLIWHDRHCLESCGSVANRREYESRQPLMVECIRRFGMAKDENAVATRKSKH